MHDTSATGTEPAHDPSAYPGHEIVGAPGVPEATVNGAQSDHAPVFVPSEERARTHNPAGFGNAVDNVHDAVPPEATAPEVHDATSAPPSATWNVVVTDTPVDGCVTTDENVGVVVEVYKSDPPPGGAYEFTAETCGNVGFPGT